MADEADPSTVFIGFGPTGQASLDITAAGSINITGLIVGQTFAGVGGGDGVVTIDGTLTSSGNITSGEGSENSIASSGLITVAGTATAANVFIGSNGGVGTISVGASGLVEAIQGLDTTTGNIYTGHGGGTGTLSIDGAVVVDTNLIAGHATGNGPGSTGVVNIYGTATPTGWDAIAGWNQSAGTFNVSATGVLNAAGKALLAANNVNAIGTFNFDGDVDAGTAYAGHSGTGAVGTFNINAGADVAVTGNFHLGQGNPTEGYANGVLNMNGGKLTALGLVANVYEFNDPNWDWVGGNSQVNLDGGKIWIDGITGFQSHGNIDIEYDGTLYLLDVGDAEGAMNWYVSLGTLTAYDGTGEISIDPFATPGWITVTAVTTADFDADGDVDGNDILRWQLGETPEQGSVAELAAWKAQFGAVSGAPMTAVAAAVPEPASLILLGLAGIDLLGETTPDCMSLGPA